MADKLLRPVLAAKLADLQRLCIEDDHELVVPRRVDRENRFREPWTRRASRSQS